MSLKHLFRLHVIVIVFSPLPVKYLTYRRKVIDWSPDYNLGKDLKYLPGYMFILQYY